MANDINVKIGGDTSQLKKKVGGLKKLFGKMGNWMALGVAGAVTAIAALTIKLVNLGDDIGKMAKRIGIGTKEFQKFNWMARRSGATSDNVEKAFKRMADTIVDAGNGMAEAKRGIESLGLSYEDLINLSPDKQFEMIAERLALVENASMKSALAQDIFGKSGTALIPMIDTYKELTTEVERLAVVMDEEAIRASEQLKDDFEDLQSSVTALAANSGFIAWLSDISAGLADILKSGNAVKSFFGNLIKAAEDGKGIFKFSELRTLKDTTGFSLSEKMGIGMGGETEAITKEDVAKESKRIKKQKDLKKQVKESVDLMKEKKKAEEAEKKLMEEVYKEIDKQEKLEEERLKKIKQQEETVASTLEQIKHQTEMQELKNKGLDKELAIKQAIYSIEQKLGRSLTEEEKKSITDATSASYDKTKPGEKKKDKLSTVMDNPEQATDALLRIGGSIGGNGNGREAMQLDKKRNDTLGKIVKLLDNKEKGIGGLETLI